MKQILFTTIVALVLVGCSKPPPPDISIHKAARGRNIEAVKQHLAAGTDVNAMNKHDETPLDHAGIFAETADLLRKHGGKTAEELKAEGK